MSVDREVVLGKLEIIKQFRSTSYIANILEVKPEDLRSWSRGEISLEEAEILEALLDTSFGEELHIGLNDEALDKVKEEISLKLKKLEDEKGIESTLEVLGNISIATFNRYKRGEIPLSAILYMKEKVSELFEPKPKDKKEEKTETSESVRKIRKLNRFKDSIKDKVSIESVKEELVIEPDIKEPEEKIVKEEAIKKEVIEKEAIEKEPIEEDTRIFKAELPKIKKKEDKEMTAKKNEDINITKLLFKGVEKEIQETLGDDVEIQKVEFTKNKIIIEAGIKIEE